MGPPEEGAGMQVENARTFSKAPFERNLLFTKEVKTSGSF